MFACILVHVYNPNLQLHILYQQYGTIFIHKYAIIIIGIIVGCQQGFP